MRLALSQSDGDVADALRSRRTVRKLLDSTVAFGPAVVAASIVGNDGTVIVAANGEGEGKPALNLPIGQGTGGAGFAMAAVHLAAQSPDGEGLRSAAPRGNQWSSRLRRFPSALRRR